MSLKQLQCRGEDFAGYVSVQQVGFMLHILPDSHATYVVTMQVSMIGRASSGTKWI